MARSSPSLENQQARPSFTAPRPSPTSINGDSSSKDTTITVDIDKEDMKHFVLGPAQEKIAAGEASKRTIFRVPKHICGKRKELFRPQIVSIGPYSRKHDGGHVDEELQDMEVVKKQFLSDLMERTTPNFFQACVEKLEEREQEIRSCYYQSFDQMKSDIFTKMMLLDGIFIIQYFMKWGKKKIYSSTIGSVQWSFVMIMHDLLLLENQIPFFLLQDLFDLFLHHRNDSSDNKELLGEILNGFKVQSELTKTKDDLTRLNVEKIKHLLHLYYYWYVSNIEEGASQSSGCCISRKKSCVNNYLRDALAKLDLKKNETGNEVGDQTPSNNNKLPSNSQSTATSPCWIIRGSNKNKHDTAIASILSATQLEEAGVEFKKKKDAATFLDVTFESSLLSAVLEIPLIWIDDAMIYKFANLISFEQSTFTNELPHIITSYAAFMDKIIDTPEDVEVLRQKGILQNMLASNEDVAIFFNQLCKYSHLDLENHYLHQVFQDVHAYCNVKCHKDWAWLCRNHCTNPWLVLSLVAAVILLILTLLQTYFAVYAYFRPPP